MFVLAQLSDPHLGPIPGAPFLDLANKRGLGLINWHRGRKRAHDIRVLAAVIADLKAQAPDHIAVTGDLVNLSLSGEYPPAAAWLAALGAPRDVTLVPGNHDVYVRGAERAPEAAWGDYMRGDDGVHRFPFLRRRGDAALIALSTALPTAPFLATGRLGARQLSRLAEMLDQTRTLFRIVLIHHPPQSAPKRHLRRLTDGAALRRVLAAKGAELLLHGHDHRRSLVWLDAANGKIPAVGAPSASSHAADPAHAAGYNLLHIGGEAGRWTCEYIARQRGADGIIRDTQRLTLR